jgi:hypothetical protein
MSAIRTSAIRRSAQALVTVAIRPTITAGRQRVDAGESL